MGTDLGGLLGDLQSAHNLKLIAVVGADGLMVESAASHDCDAEAISAVAANGLLMMSELGQELGDGDAEVTTLEYANHTVLLSPLDSDNLLVLATDGKTQNLGQLRIMMRRSGDRIREAFNSSMNQY
jgi:predicted regulator of Ras-like GTPase activity (Roadblock/LC7/MglB family)